MDFSRDGNRRGDRASVRSVRSAVRIPSATRHSPGMLVALALAAAVTLVAGLASSIAWVPLTRFGATSGSAALRPGGRKAALVEAAANGMLGFTPGAALRIRNAERSADGQYTVQWRSSVDGVDRDVRLRVAGKHEALVAGGRRAVALAALRNNMIDSPPAPPPRPPRERKQTEVEKQADAIVHAVVAVELLTYHGKLGGTLETAFRKCVYEPALPRLRRLTERGASSDDFKIENGIKRSRPSRVHDSQLEKQFTLGDLFTTQALKELSRLDDGMWYTRAEYEGRQALVECGVPGDEDPAAKDLVAWSQATAKVGSENKIVEFGHRSTGHNDAEKCIWILPVFVDHDRSNHAERQAMLMWLSALPIDQKSEGVTDDVTGTMRVYASHTPCISCLSSMCQLTRAFPNAKLSVTFDIWKETKRWLGMKDPEEIVNTEE